MNGFILGLIFTPLIVSGLKLESLPFWPTIIFGGIVGAISEYIYKKHRNTTTP